MSVPEEGLLHDPSALRPERGLSKPELEAERLGRNKLNSADMPEARAELRGKQP